jgi:hypothetical protein
MPQKGWLWYELAMLDFWASLGTLLLRIEHSSFHLLPLQKVGGAVMILADFKPQTTPASKVFSLVKDQRVLLMPIGDVHFGAEGFPSERFADHIRWGVDRGAYFLGMGDIMEFTSKSQRFALRGLRDSQRALMDGEAEESVDKLVRLLVKTGSKGRWIGWLEGDHFYEFLDGTTSDQRLCGALGGTFLGTSTLLRLVLKDTPGHRACDVYVYATHGLRKGLAPLEQMMKFLPQPSIYLMAHDHSKINTAVDALMRTPAGYLYHTTKIIARTGGWLRGYLQTAASAPSKRAIASRGSYVERGAMLPSALGGLVFSIGLKRTHTRPGGGEEDFCQPDIHYSI